MKVDPLDNPARNAATLRNLVNGFRAITVDRWFEEATFDQVVEAYWAAQTRLADEDNRRNQRV